MNCRLEVLFTPADFATLGARNLSQTTCVVFDVLRATSSMVTALAHGAAAVIPVGEISEALARRRSDPEVLLAGERDGLRISSALAGGTEFDLGNSPREFTPDRVQGRQIAMTTTNGTRALRAASGAMNVLIGSFLNLTATSKFIEKLDPVELILVCSGTYEGSAYEDVLGAGALCDLLWARLEKDAASDSAQIARQVYVAEQGNLAGAVARHSWNARRLLGVPQLSEDVAYCLQRDVFPVVAGMEKGDRVIVRS